VVDASSNSSNDAAQGGFPGVEGTQQIMPGHRIPLVPRQMLKLFADIDFANAWSVGAELNAVGRSTARGNENGQHQPDGMYYLGAGYNPGYAVFNLNAAWRPSPGVKLFAQVSNLFDRQYSSAAQLGATGFNDAGSFQSRPFPADANGARPLRHTTFLAPGAPRAFSVGLKYQF
jgi:outer membrane receptor protein involved in Fe transport